MLSAHDMSDQYEGSDWSDLSDAKLITDATSYTRLQARCKPQQLASETLWQNKKRIVMIERPEDVVKAMKR